MHESFTLYPSLCGRLTPSSQVLQAFLPLQMPTKNPSPTSVSAESLTGIIADLQAALLAELAQSEGAIAAEAAAFHKAQSEQLTTDLDARLRKHRPRAGPVEEELRSKRWVGGKGLEFEKNIVDSLGCNMTDFLLFQACI